MSNKSSSVTLSRMTLRSLATWRANGLPGPPLLPLAQRPLDSWPFAGVCAAFSVGRDLDMDRLLKGFREGGRGGGGMRTLSKYYSRGGNGGVGQQPMPGYARFCHLIQSVPWQGNLPTGQQADSANAALAGLRPTTPNGPTTAGRGFGLFPPRLRARMGPSAISPCRKEPPC